MANSKFTGTGVALVTPFDKAGVVDYNGLGNLLQYTADNGVDYWVVQGTTGESPTVTNTEKIDILKFVICNNPKDLPIVYGIGGNSTAQVIDTIENTELDGVDTILSASPYYNKPSQAGIIQHYQQIADASPIPIILYNVPGRTSSNLSAETTLELAKHPNIIGIKEASGDMEQCMKILNGKKEDFFLTSGDDLLTVALMSMGAIGTISVLANGLPKLFSKMVGLALEQNYVEATEVAFKFLEINPLLYAESNPVGIKEVLSQLDLCTNHTRLPILPASNQLKVQIQAALGRL